MNFGHKIALLLGEYVGLGILKICGVLAEKMTLFGEACQLR